MADTTETGLPRAVAIAWGMQETPQRGPSRGLSHERIVEAAITIADQDGLSAVTMQSVARSLGFTTMSLYRYVSSKEELLQLVGDAGVQLPQKVTLSDDWREALRQWAGMIRELWRARPWLLEIPRGQTSVLMPNSVRAADLGLSALEPLPLDPDEKIGVILVISEHVATMVRLGFSLAEEGLVSVSEEGLAQLSEVVTAERFPHVGPLFHSREFLPDPADGVGETPHPPPESVDAEFDLGLDLIIAGLEVRARAAEKSSRED